LAFAASPLPHFAQEGRGTAGGATGATYAGATGATGTGTTGATYVGATGAAYATGAAGETARRLFLRRPARSRSTTRRKAKRRKIPK
jgi:hypothetical protein